MKTKATKISQVRRNWHLIDAQDQVLGRLSTEIAAFLTGKNKVDYVGYLDGGDHVVVINSDKVKVTGRKTEDKMYYRHSGYPGGFKQISFARQMEKDSRKVIRLAVAGMLPKNKHRQPRMARLKVFPGPDHPYVDKFKQNKPVDKKLK